MLFSNIFRSCLGFCISTAGIVVLLAGIALAEENSGAVPVEPSNVPAISQVISAQPDRINSDYVTGCFTDAGKILVSPAHWDGSDWLKAGLVIGAASGLYFADADIRNFAQRNQSSIGDKGATVGNAVGNPFYILPPLGLFYLYGHLNEDLKARRTSLLAVESLAISGAFTGALKFATHRPRPYSGQAATTWHGPSSDVKGDPSFPSSHTTAVFSIASVFAEEYDTNPYVAPIAYSVASLTAFARVYDDKHWASDVFFGGVIGYFVGKAVVRYHTAQEDAQLKILPTVSQQGFGVTAEYRF